ncbi:MAG: hypothetical protein ACP5NY_01870 [Thermocladium sp.]
MSFDAFVMSYSVAVSITVFAALVILLYYLVFNKSLMAKITGSAQSQHPQLIEFAVLKCPQCGFEKKRAFNIGDYVGKIDAEKCPHDGSQLVISAIAKETPKE